MRETGGKRLRPATSNKRFNISSDSSSDSEADDGAETAVGGGTWSSTDLAGLNWIRRKLAALSPWNMRVLWMELQLRNDLYRKFHFSSSQLSGAGSVSSTRTQNFHSQQISQVLDGSGNFGVFLGQLSEAYKQLFADFIDQLNAQKTDCIQTASEHSTASSEHSTTSSEHSTDFYAEICKTVSQHGQFELTGSPLSVRVRHGDTEKEKPSPNELALFESLKRKCDLVRTESKVWLATVLVWRLPQLCQRKLLYTIRKTMVSACENCRQLCVDATRDDSTGQATVSVGRHLEMALLPEFTAITMNCLDDKDNGKEFLGMVTGELHQLSMMHANNAMASGTATASYWQWKQRAVLARRIYLQMVSILLSLLGAILPVFQCGGATDQLTNVADKLLGLVTSRAITRAGEPRLYYIVLDMFQSVLITLRACDYGQNATVKRFLQESRPVANGTGQPAPPSDGMGSLNLNPASLPAGIVVLDSDQSRKSWQSLLKRLRKDMGEISRQATSPEQPVCFDLEPFVSLLPAVRRQVNVNVASPSQMGLPSNFDLRTRPDDVRASKNSKPSSQQPPARVQLVQNPWDIVEGLRSPLPMSYSWFAAIRWDRKSPRWEQLLHQMLYHSHEFAARDHVGFFLEPLPVQVSHDVADKDTITDVASSDAEPNLSAGDQVGLSAADGSDDSSKLMLITTDAAKHSQRDASFAGSSALAASQQTTLNSYGDLAVSVAHVSQPYQVPGQTSFGPSNGPAGQSTGEFLMPAAPDSRGLELRAMVEQPVMTLQRPVNFSSMGPQQSQIGDQMNNSIGYSSGELIQLRSAPSMGNVAGTMQATFQMSTAIPSSQLGDRAPASVTYTAPVSQSQPYVMAAQGSCKPQLQTYLQKRGVTPGPAGTIYMSQGPSSGPMTVDDQQQMMQPSMMASSSVMAAGASADQLRPQYMSSVGQRYASANPAITRQGRQKAELRERLRPSATTMGPSVQLNRPTGVGQTAQIQQQLASAGAPTPTATMMAHPTNLRGRITEQVMMQSPMAGRRLPLGMVTQYVPQTPAPQYHGPVAGGPASAAPISYIPAGMAPPPPAGYDQAPGLAPTQPAFLPSRQPYQFN